MCVFGTSLWHLLLPHIGPLTQTLMPGSSSPLENTQKELPLRDRQSVLLGLNSFQVALHENCLGQSVRSGAHGLV